MLSFSISRWDLMEFHYFADTIERGDRGWEQAQRQGEDRMTLRISLLFFILTFHFVPTFGKTGLCNIPSLEYFADNSFSQNYCSLPFSSSSKVELESLWLGVSFNEVRIIESVMFTLVFFFFFESGTKLCAVFFQHLYSTIWERKGGFGIPESGFDWVTTLFWLSFNALKLLNFCILFCMNDWIGGGGVGNHSSLGCSCMKPWALLDRWSWV